MNQICLVEDEQKVSAFIRKGLEEHGYAVTVAPDGKTAREALKTKCNLFILDIMLPDINGIELCRQIINLAPEMIRYLAEEGIFKKCQI